MSFRLPFERSARLALGACLLGACPGVLACGSSGDSGDDWGGPVTSAGGSAGSGAALTGTGGAGTIGGADLDSGLDDFGGPNDAWLTGSIFASGYPDVPSSGLGGAPGLSTTYGIGRGDLSVLVIYDRSGSMSDDWDGGAKWAVASRALLDGMAGVEEEVTMGTLFFPTDERCEVLPFDHARHIQLQSGTTFKTRWEAYPASRFPGGDTPLGAAFEQAHLAVMEAVGFGLVGGGRRLRVVLVTDGEPNCGTDPDRVLELAATWRSYGVELAVIGLPGSVEAAGLLDELAKGGGAPAHAAPETRGEAEDEFSAVVR